MTIKNFAEQLSEAMLAVDDAKIVIKGVIDAAKDQGINIRALKKVAREMIADSAKLAKQYADEEQLDLFRAEVGIFARKGLAMTEKAETAHRALGEKKLEKAARELDAVAGSDIAGSYAKDKEKIKRWRANQIEKEAAE